ncbi:hypothetical protein TNCV_385041 [Trichonephila clavipes]|nr:hypothetical protein TNCV_385041 [Trichonephila clavipes]
MFTIRAMHQRSTSEMQRQVIIIRGIIRSYGLVRHSKLIPMDERQMNHVWRCQQETMIRVIRYSNVISSTNDFRWSKKKKFKELSFREQGGRSTCPLLTTTERWLRTITKTFTGSPSSSNHMVWSTMVSTSCSNSRI